jgi:hypothetical protein
MRHFDLNEIRIHTVPPRPRTCDVCGCTDRHACEGGCRWLGEGLCSACLPYPFTHCVLCGKVFPQDHDKLGDPLHFEDAFRHGWSADGVCVRCLSDVLVPPLSEWEESQASEQLRIWREEHCPERSLRDVLILTAVSVVFGVVAFFVTAHFWRGG